MKKGSRKAALPPLPAKSAELRSSQEEFDKVRKLTEDVSSNINAILNKIEMSPKRPPAKTEDNFYKDQDEKPPMQQMLL